MNAPLDASRLVASLKERYSIERGWVYMTGTQALVRLPIQQRMRDAAAGLNTGGYISGYRGSPLGRYDMELWAANDVLTQHNVVFRPGVNEDLAATALWGAQYVGVFPGATVDGVFGLWYGKGPGIDRSGDPFRHANLAGTSPHGGVLVMAGDDHGAKSSTVANYSDLNFVAAGIPLLYPSNAQELIDFGLHGIAMGRYSGCWTGMKLVTDVVEGGGSVWVAPDSPQIVTPPEQPLPPGGVHTRPFDMAVPQEDRLYHHKLYRALAYAQANELNRIALDSREARLGIVAAGKAYQDLQQALVELGLDADRADAFGLRVLKVGMVWPLDPQIVRRFAAGLQTILVVEEKRPLLEDQIRALLYGTERAPRIVGKHAGKHLFDADRGPIVFPNAGEINPSLVAKALVDCMLALEPGCRAPLQLAAAAGGPAVPVRIPNFCSGCPHGRSTKIPDGSRALAGIGCHTIAMLNEPTKTTTVSHMGGEGAMWLGQQPFTTEPHVFANMGDGTYFHSGFMAIRAAVAAHVPITYKLLHNGFVSMTGGQPVDGELTVPQVIAELQAEGVKKIALVTDEPAKYKDIALPPGVPVFHRTELEAVQREFREYRDVSVIIYEQPCATERRRLRKRGKWADPDKRVFINAEVCEGCGDCSKVSGCLSIEPLETEFGRKRRINQSSCNKDYSCVEGFCPSFVTVHGGKLRNPAKSAARQGNATEAAGEAEFAELPEPALPQIDRSFSIVIAGIGGTGVVTIGQTLAVAAHLEGHYSSNLDVTGLAQKYGAVLSHVKLAPEPQLLHATRVAAGEADTLIACDLIVAAGDETVSKLAPGRSAGVVCTDMVPTAEFSRNPDWSVDTDALTERVRKPLGERALLLEGQRLATALLGDAIATNMFMLGAAWQRGQVPLSLAAIDRAIELNGVQIELNRKAFLWGRRAAHDLDAVERIAAAATPASAQVIRFDPRQPETLDEIVRRRREVLTEYQSVRLADRYEAIVERVREAEARQGLGDSLAKAVAKYLFKLMSHKDEFEVARLYTQPGFKRELDKVFEGDYTVHFHVAGGPFGRKDPVTGKLVKREVGPWLMTAFRVLAPMRFLRGTLLDPFRNSAERKLARELLQQYEQDLERLLERLDASNHATAVKMASLPDRIRGYGHVREQHAQAVSPERDKLWAQMAPAAQPEQFEAA